MRCLLLQLCPLCLMPPPPLSLLLLLLLLRRHSPCRYGAPHVDGRYMHWDHEVLPHWNEHEAKKHPHGQRFDPPANVHAPYYPALGPYSSRDPEAIRRHCSQLRAANASVLVRNSLAVHSSCGNCDPAVHWSCPSRAGV